MGLIDCGSHSVTDIELISSRFFVLDLVHLHLSKNLDFIARKICCSMYVLRRNMPQNEERAAEDAFLAQHIAVERSTHSNA